MRDSASLGGLVSEPWVGLADAIEAIRAELIAAQAAGAGSPIRFAAEPVEVEWCRSGLVGSGRRRRRIG